jgi:hypothetical protein
MRKQGKGYPVWVDQEERRGKAAAMRGRPQPVSGRYQRFIEQAQGQQRLFLEPMTHPGVTGRKPDVPDQLVPDAQVRLELGGISAMSLHRWERDRALDFPRVVIVRGRKFRWRHEFERFKSRLTSASADGSARTAQPAKVGGLVGG